MLLGLRVLKGRKRSGAWRAIEQQHLAWRNALSGARYNGLMHERRMEFDLAGNPRGLRAAQAAIGVRPR